MNIKNISNCLLGIACEKLPIVLMIWGKNGIGKTEMCVQLVERLKKETGKDWFFHVESNITADRSDYGGLPQPKEITVQDSEGKDQKVWVQDKALPSWIVKALYQGNCVLFFDEFNRGTKDTMNALFEIIGQGSINGQKLKEVLMVCAGNPNDARFHTKETDTAFKDRVTHVLANSDVDVWLEWAKENNIDESIIHYIRENPKSLDAHHDADMKLPVTPEVSPRAWGKRCDGLLKLEKVGRKYGITTEMIDELIDGTIGIEEGLKFNESRKAKDQPIKLAEIFNLNEEILKRIKKYANPAANSDGHNVIELGLLDPVCVDLVDENNREKVKENFVNVLTFLQEIPSSLTLKVVNQLVQSMEDNKFWEAKIMEIEKNSDGSDKVVNNQPVYRWLKILEKQAADQQAQEKANEMHLAQLTAKNAAKNEASKKATDDPNNK